MSLEDRPGLRALCPLVFVCVESRTQLEIVNRARRLCSAMHIVDARCASQFLFGSQSSFSVRHHKAKKKTKKMQLRNCDGRDYMEKKCLSLLVRVHFISGNHLTIHTFE